MTTIKSIIEKKLDFTEYSDKDPKALDLLS